MNRIQETFGRERVLLPVIHVTDKEQALRNTAIAVEAGTDGVFLINHDVRSDGLIEIFQEVRRKYPSIWLGINVLDLNPFYAFQTVRDQGANGLWTDTLFVPEENGGSIPRLWDGLYFGGAAFKYQNDTRDLGLIVREAMAFSDIVTTSGEETGSPPDSEKIKTMHHMLWEHPMAIASGITLENIHQFLPLCECYLVATGISSNFTELDPVRTEALAQVIHNFSP